MKPNGADTAPRTSTGSLNHFPHTKLNLRLVSTLQILTWVLSSKAGAVSFSMWNTLFCWSRQRNPRRTLCFKNPDRETQIKPIEGLIKLQQDWLPGVARCRKLSKIEQWYGYKSYPGIFNILGYYRLPQGFCLIDNVELTNCANSAEIAEQTH